jgi:soluble lytic murein transglycosylase-like protein
MGSGPRLDSRRSRQSRLVLAAGVAILLIAVAVNGLQGGGAPPLPLPGIGRPARSRDPFGYVSAREPAFVARAVAGNAHVLFTKSPGGVIATAARVVHFRRLITSATAGSGIDPDLVEGLVFLESAGRPNAIAGPDPASAAGLTQILASTGQALLGMHIDLARSRKITAAIDRAFALGQTNRIGRLQAQRTKVDDRFNPSKALAATVRYLELSQRRFGRVDLAFESYHMGIGNLAHVLDDYDGGRPIPYVQLYFDTAPDRHTSAYRLLSGFGDDSSLYWWRVLAAVQIMRMYRSDPHALSRLASLQTAEDSAAEVLHPPADTSSFATPDALDAAYARRQILPLPSNAASLGLRYDPGMGSLARRLGVSTALYRGLRPPALDLMIELAVRVKMLSHSRQPLVVTSAVQDLRYQRLLGISDPPAAAGYSFTIARQYAGQPQALAFQAMLDRLQALNLIAWERYPSEIEVTVAGDSDRFLAGGP